MSTLDELRVLVVAPTGRDAALITSFLTERGIGASDCVNVVQAVDELGQGAGALVVADEALIGPDTTMLVEALNRQPPWSDLPAILLTLPRSETSAESQIALLANVTVIERPVGVNPLVTAIRAALRARRRQYEVRDQLQQLEQVGHELQAANARKDELLGLVSHELRTPLTLVLGAGDLLHRRIDLLDIPDRNELLGTIIRNGERLKRVIENMLVLAQVETRGSISLEPVLLQRLLPPLLAGLEPLQGNHQLRTSFGESVPPVLANATFVQQIVENLVRNSEKYSAVGTVDVSVSSHDAEVTVSVSDCGRTMVQAEVDQMLETFYRDPVASRRVSGLGLGLPVCRRLAEAQHGSLVAHPRDGGGLVVTLSLPAAEAVSDLGDPWDDECPPPLR